MQNRAVHKPTKVNQDKDAKYLALDEARYMLNNERNIGGGGLSKNGKTTPMPANELMCDIEIDDSNDNKKPFPIGSYRSELTNEIYTFYYNEGGYNFITRVNDDKTCEIVYEGECLNFSTLPEHAIKNWRVYLKYDQLCANQGGKILIWTDGINPIGMLDVEASIATNSFSTDFFKRCYDGCAYTQMCVPEPCGALEGDFLEVEDSEIGLNNKLVDVGIQVMYQHVYYDQRASEWSDISTLFYQNSKGGCLDGDDNASRCILFRVPIGNPMVDKIKIAFRYNNSPNWFLSDTIEKYKPYNNNEQQWYERELNDLPNYSDEDCAFDYTFCNDKQCDPIDPEETNRVFNPIPREAQGLIKIKDSLAFYNYKKGNCPISEKETKKIEISLGESEGCDREFVTVKFRAIVHRLTQGFNCPIYRLGGNAGLTSPDDLTDRAYFGGCDYNGVPDPHESFGLYFNGEIRNFIGYVEGTDYWAVMKQYVYAPWGNITQLYDAPVANLADSGWAYALRNLRSLGTFFYQEGIITVPKGTKGFIRLAGHQSLDGTGFNQDTSTLISGTIPSISAYNNLGWAGGGNKNVPSILERYKEELYFDTCDGNVEIEETFIIDDNDIEAEGGKDGANGVSGYIRSSNGDPLEGLEVWMDGSLRDCTDHNGFFNFNIYGGITGNRQLDIRGELSNAGDFLHLKYENVTLAPDTLTSTIIEIDNEDYQENYFEQISIPLLDCDNNPVSGVRVALSGSKYQVTQPITGVATFRVRNYRTRAREVRGVVMDGRGCFNSDCEGNCGACLPATDLVLLPSTFEGVNYQVIPLDSLLNISFVNYGDKGLKAGGRYGWGVVLKGSCGQISSVYPVTVLDGSTPMPDSYMNIPKTQEKGFLNFPNFNYNAANAEFPDWADCLILTRTINQNPYVLQWVIDKEERLPNGQIRLTIQSLNDYNALYNFNSNTVYQYAEGDRVEFINDGSGNIFDIDTYGLLNYKILSPFNDEVISGETEAPANFFNQILIENDRRLPLNSLVGGKIEIQRPKDCSEEYLAYHSVLVLPLIEVSGKKILVQPSGSFTTFDTYLVTRSIGSSPVQIFEHRNPSDFWGDRINGISDIGKAYFINKFENEKRYGRNITINTPNQYNRFGDFEKTLDVSEQGDLVSMFVYDGKIGLGIGQYDNFLFQIADDFLRVSNDGVVRAATANEIISDAEPKIVGRFGCQYPHIGSIYFGDGWVTWADVSKSAFIKHDFNSAKNIAEGQMKSYFAKKWAFMDYENTKAAPLFQFRFSTGFNEHTKALQLTMRRLIDRDTTNAKKELESENETILIDVEAEEFLTWASYTPNEYSNITLKDGRGSAFVTFVNGGTYNHPITSSIYNRFYEVAVDRVITFACNQEQDIIKRFISLEIQDEMMWFVHEVLTDNVNFVSEIPPIKFSKEENNWGASFLSNKNARGGIYAVGEVGVKPLGYYALITIVRDNTDGLKYNTVDNNKRIKYDELDMVLVKYFHSELSGMKTNL